MDESDCLIRQPQWFERFSILTDLFQNAVSVYRALFPAVEKSAPASPLQEVGFDAPNQLSNRVIWTGNADDYMFMNLLYDFYR